MTIIKVINIKKILFMLIIITISSFFNSCKSKKEFRKVVNMKMPIIDKNYELDVLDTTGFEIVNAQIVKDVLVLDIRHAGYTFDLYSRGMYAKSMPPKLSIELKRKYNDSDDKIALDRFQFDAKPLRYGENGSVYITLAKYPKPILYVY